MLIRQINPIDLDDIYAIETACHPFPWSRSFFESCLQNPQYESWLLQSDDNKEILGFAIISIIMSEAELLNICVRPTWQEYGFGRQLLSHVLQIAKQKDARAMFLEIRESNQAALKLYQKYGFSQIGLRKNYYPAVIPSNQNPDTAIQTLKKSHKLPTQLRESFGVRAN